MGDSRLCGVANWQLVNLVDELAVGDKDVCPDGEFVDCEILECVPSVLD